MNLSSVSFQEKSVWVSLAIILLVFTAYFSQVFVGLATGTLGKPQVFLLFMGAVIAVVALEVALHIVMAVVNPREAGQRRDERERLFAMRAGNIGGSVLGIGVLVIAARTFVLDLDPVWVANLLLLAVFVSQTVNYALQLVFYRRGH